MAVILRTMARGTGLSSDPYFLSMHWNPATVGGSNTDATNALADFRTLWENCKTKIATGLTITYDPTVLAIEDTTGVLAGVFSATPVANTTTSGGTAPLPYQTQGLIQWTTGTIINGRRLRGRTFVPAPDEGDNGTGGLPTSSYTSSIDAAIAGFMAAVAGTVPSIWHRPSSPGASDGSSGDVVTGDTSATWSVQRTRR